MKNSLITLCFLLFNVGAFAQTANSPRITVFKDGTGFFEKTIEIPIKNKKAIIQKLPYNISTQTNELIGDTYIDNRVILGSLRFVAPANNIVQILAKDTLLDFIEEDKESYYQTVGELLKLNIGKQVSISYEAEPNQISGLIKKLLPETQAIYNSFQYENLILQTNNTFHVLNINKIKSISFGSEPIIINPERKKHKKKLENIEITFEKDKPNQILNISYLQKGISWIPEYYIDIIDQKNAILKLDAHLLNDIEDFSNANINFAVGFPVFKYASIPSPISQITTVQGLLSGFARMSEISSYPMQNIMSQRISTQYRNNEPTLQQAEGTNNEDLFFYTSKNISMKKGNRLLVNIFEKNIQFEDIFSVKLETNTNRYSDEGEISPKVWHSLKFLNPVNMPLTTGEIFFNKKNNGELKTISQNQLNYTPANEFAIAEMSIAPDILVQNSETEIDRQNAKNSDYLVTMEANIEIHNYKSNSIKIIVSKDITGDLQETNFEWKYTSVVAPSDNKLNKVTWTLEIPAGKTEKIKYTYKYLVD